MTEIQKMKYSLRVFKAFLGDPETNQEQLECDIAKLEEELQDAELRQTLEQDSELPNV